MEDLNKVIEYTSVKFGTTPGDARSLCKQALINGYRAVCVNSGFVKVCYEELKNHPEVLIVSTAGFPTGASSYRAKIYEAICAAEEGAKEIDFMINLGLLKDRKDKELRDEIKGVVRNTAGMADVKIIVEAPLLTPEELVRVCTIAAEEKAAWIKTATGFNGDTTVDMVKGIKKIVGKQCKIKAAGGIRDIETAKEMLKAGATSIGTSSLLKFED
ncbi:MAG: deoxyribose-phosphate aldolase [Anaerovoracaceae bacterium]